MNTIFVQLGMHILILAIFYAFYRLVLSRETFFQFNRAVLLAGIIASVVLPFLRPSYTVNLAMSDTAVEPGLLSVVSAEPEMISAFSGTNHWWEIVLSIYGGVLLILLGRWLLQLYSIFSQARRNGAIHLDGIQVVDTNRYPSPFSFFHLTFVDLPRYEGRERSKILAHEKAHVQQRHWIDLLLIQLLGIVVWINPVIWWYEKAIKQNHEFLADAAVLDKGIDRRKYQALILQQILGGGPPVSMASYLFTRHYKNRFEMMNQKRSNQIKKLKIAGILPLLAIILWAFAQPVYQTTTTSVLNEVPQTSKEEIVVKGKVVNAQTGAPIPGASVVVINTTSGRVSDRNGDFLIKVETGATLAISYIGFRTERVLVSNENFLEVQLASNYYKIKPVEPVSGKNKTSKEEVKISGEVFEVVEALPYYKDSDNQKLFKEVNQAIKKFSEGSEESGVVTVHFMVSRSGQVSDVSIHESSNPKLDKAAEDIIRKLDQWVPGNQRGKDVDTRLSLTLKFQ